MAWKDNSAIFIHDGSIWQKVSDHNRGPIQVNVERIETTTRMANGTLRRYVVAKKRDWTLTWDSFPSRKTPTFGGKTGMGTVDGGWAGEDLETFHNNTDGSFLIKIRGGDDDGKATTDASIEEVRVMITQFNKEITKRGVVDLWSLSMTLTEV